MSKMDQRIDEATRDTRAGLSLELSEGPQPFSLVGDEVKFTPEDWAWLFLSMNSEYQTAYAARTEAHTKDVLRPGRREYGDFKPDTPGPINHKPPRQYFRAAISAPIWPPENNYEVNINSVGFVHLRS